MEVTLFEFSNTIYHQVIKIIADIQPSTITIIKTVDQYDLESENKLTDISTDEVMKAAGVDSLEALKEFMLDNFFLENAFFQFRDFLVDHNIDYKMYGSGKFKN